MTGQLAYAISFLGLDGCSTTPTTPPPTYAPTSGAVAATNVSYNAAIPTGGSVSIGFQATHTGDAAAPAEFALNGTACGIA